MIYKVVISCFFSAFIFAQNAFSGLNTWTHGSTVGLSGGGYLISFQNEFRNAAMLVNADRSLKLSIVRYPADINAQSAIINTKLNNHHFGFAVKNINYGTFDSRTADNILTGSFSANDTQIQINYARFVYKNKIILGKNSELHCLEFVVNDSKRNFFNNVYEDIILDDSAILKNICLQNSKSSGYFHKYSKNKLSSQSSLTSFIFPTGLKFNKLDLEINLEGERSECNLQSASFLNNNEHQEVKTRVNHLFPNCKSYQKVKNVLTADSKGVYQGKIFVKDVAQKTDAYQLSKAILLSEGSEFDSKPELEIYADDVKCSHGSTSGSLDKDSVYYLMTRGLSKKESTKLLVNGFLNEVADSIKSESIKNFIKIKLDNQLLDEY